MKGTVCAILFLLVIPRCFAQVSETKAKDLIKTAECFRAYVSDPELSRITRNEGFEDDLLRFQLAFSRRPERFLIFTASKYGYFRTSSGEIVIVSTNGAPQEVVMVVSEKSGQVFGVHGCANADKEFSRLIREARIRINDTIDAKLFAHFRYRMVDDPKIDRLVVTSRDFRHVAENVFFGNFPQKLAEKNFKVWSKTFAHHENKLGLGVRATSSSRGFATSITHLMGSRDGVTKLFQTTLDVSAEGEYSYSTNQLYPK